MFPHPFEHTYPNPLDSPMLFQAFQNMMRYNAINNFFLASQGQALQYQYHQMMHMNAQLLQNSLKAQAMCTQSDCKSLKSVSDLSNLSTVPFVMSNQIQKSTEVGSCKLSGFEKRNLKLESAKEKLTGMITLLLDRIGRFDCEKEISKLRERYSEDSKLLSVFDSIVTKYQSVKKHREDIVRFIIRKALKSIKNRIVKKEKVYGKRAYAILCKKYFHINYEELKKSGVNTSDEKELIEVLLPYRKNSKNRTINTSFTSEIFSSKEFQEDYSHFLKGFSSFIVDENNKKTQKLIDLAEECLEKNSTVKIRKCVRLPWLQVWVEKTLETAHQLPSIVICKKEEDEGDDSSYGDDKEEDVEEEEEKEKEAPKRGQKNLKTEK